jgi:signal transduction histidine kinase
VRRLLRAVLALPWWAAARSPGPSCPAPADEQALAALREAERLKRELVAVVSHEFRTPLTSILGYASTLERRGEQMDRATMQAGLRAIERQARRLERTVANLLVASGEPEPPRGDTADLRAVAGVVGEGLRAASRVQVEVEEGLRVRIGEGSLVRVLEHLVDNALKFSTPATPVTVRAWRAGDQAVLEVADQGTPIAEADLERIFEAFVQADSSDTRPVEGMGLGLAIVRRVVNAHGGSVEARSVPPEVVVRVTLPLAQPAEAASLAGVDPATRRLTEYSHGAG